MTGPAAASAEAAEPGDPGRSPAERRRQPATARRPPEERDPASGMDMSPDQLFGVNLELFTATGAEHPRTAVDPSQPAAAAAPGPGPADPAAEAAAAAADQAVPAAGDQIQKHLD